MNAELRSITNKLEALGIGKRLLNQIKKGIAKAAPPPLTEDIIERLREVAAADRRAMLVLGRHGHYSVFTVKAHAALRATARKHKPWAAKRRKHGAMARAAAVKP